MGRLGESLKAAAVAGLVKSGGHRAFLCRNRHRVTILMYHGFYEKERCDGLEQYGSRWCEIGDFERHLRYLTRHAHVVSLERLVDHYREGATLPDNAVVITMDDGYASNHRLAFPLLKKMGIPACIFVSSNFVEHHEYLWPDRIEYAVWKTNETHLSVGINGRAHRLAFGSEQDKLEAVDRIKQSLKGLSHAERMTFIEDVEDKTGWKLGNDGRTPPLLEPLRWAEIREMTQEAPISIGSHSVHHPNLTTCTDEQLREELVESKALIGRKTGKDCTFFCFPGGAFDARVKRFVEEAGYLCALTIGGLFETRERTDLYELKRIGVAQGMHTYGFIGRLLR